MMADQWTRAVRRQLGFGRLLPLGGPRDGAWITERAAESVLRRAARHVPGAHLGTLRLALADPNETHEPAVPPPPSALPPGPLRINADFTATLATGEPLPAVASRLRATLAEAATERLGLTVTEVDLRVTGLLEEREAGATEDDETDVRPDEPKRPTEPEADDESRVAAAALAVPGVSRLTGTLAGLGRAVHIEERPGETTLPRRHVRIELEARASHRTLDVAREVREAASAALPDHPSVAVLITGVTD
ncbi:nucleopolyhedrovirus P10 family protein [Streptomyces sp. CA-288835]|uniref:nucleopolyhedrovirus P10 family protein n=1 Tax=Streptomyces sp. CA-288835 TaxID=3240069 RepID=UPI003D8F9E99